MFRVAIVNSKGGSGKTTLATNLASYYTANKQKTALIDFDSQGSSTFWVARRADNLPVIQSIAAYKQPGHVTSSWFMHPERGTQKVIIDSPSGLNVAHFRQTLHDCDAVLIPVLPSAIDIHAVAHFIADILLQGKFKREEGRIAVVANRARRNTLVYQRLETFLNSLGIPFVTTLRDTQEYIKSGEQGLGIFELARTHPKDLASWQPLLEWLDSCEASSNNQHKRFDRQA